MTIPDEAAKRYPILRAFADEPARTLLREAFIAGAEWARREALREAADVIAAEEGPPQDFWGMERAEEIIRALADRSR